MRLIKKKRKVQDHNQDVSKSFMYIIVLFYTSKLNIFAYVFLESIDLNL